MKQAEFQTNITGAKTFEELSDSSDSDSDFWSGYQRGLRRHYHGEKFGTAQEHKLWMSLADDSDYSRKMRGLGYRAGFENQNVQQAMKSLAGCQYMSDIGRLGGSSTSPKKSAAARINGALGGRPRKTPV